MLGVAQPTEICWSAYWWLAGHGTKDSRKDTNAMKSTLSALLLAVVSGSVGHTPAAPIAFAQTVVSGTWRAESIPPGTTWTAVFRVDGPKVNGTVTSCSSMRSTIEVFDGRVDREVITFKCTSPNGARTLTLTGKITGDEIAFTWEKTGPGGNPSDDALFGASAPREFSAKRVPDMTICRADCGCRHPARRLAHIFGKRPGPSTPVGLKQVTNVNVKQLELTWLSQAVTSNPNDRLEATPLVVDGVMYTTRNANDVVALDAATGRVLWVQPYTPTAAARATGGGGRPNRGLAVLRNTLYLATLDAHLNRDRCCLWKTAVEYDCRRRTRPGLPRWSLLRHDARAAHR